MTRLRVQVARSRLGVLGMPLSEERDYTATDSESRSTILCSCVHNESRFKLLLSCYMALSGRCSLLKCVSLGQYHSTVGLTRI